MSGIARSKKKKKSIFGNRRRSNYTILLQSITAYFVTQIIASCGSDGRTCC